jgi:hypothetical protein
VYLRLTLAAIALLVLAGTHWKAYVSGGDAVRAQHQGQVIAAEQSARTKERELLTAKQRTEEAYEQDKRKAATAAAAARTELDRLRVALARRGEPAPGATSSTSTDDARGPERELLGACAADLQSMAAEADRLAGKVTGLQGYVTDVCLAINPAATAAMKAE